MNLTNNNPSTLVYLVDDEFAIRDSLTLLIESSGQTVRSFESAESFLNNYDPEQPGCLVLDVRMPLMTGLELQEELSKREINIPIIFMGRHLTVEDAVSNASKAFRAGALDFLEIPFNNGILLDRINEAIKKDMAYREEYSKKRLIQDRINQLTSREKEVLGLIIKSHSNTESAKILNISKRVVDVHRASIMKKMQADNVIELITMVYCCNEI